IGRRAVRPDEDMHQLISSGLRSFRYDNIISQTGGPTTRFSVNVDGQSYVPSTGGWESNNKRMAKFYAAEGGAIWWSFLSFISYIRYLEDFPASPINNLWDDLRWGFDASEKRYVVETNPRIVERCLLMVTDPGDLVLDPTCGSGTTAYVAEQWGRRWITVDTNRVSIAIARQRLLTSRFDFYQLHNEAVGVEGNFNYKTVPHITLKSIAQNTNLDPIFAKHQPILDKALQRCNGALNQVTDVTRQKLAQK